MRFKNLTAAVLILCLSFAAQAEQVATPRLPSAEELQAQRIDQAAKRLAEAQDERKGLYDALSQMRQKVRAQTGLLEVNSEAIHQVIGKLQEQREQLELDGAGAAGRSKGLDEALAELSAKLKARAAAADPVADELAKVVEARQNQLDRVNSLSAQAVVSKEAVDTAKENLAAARAELAAARQKSASNASAEVLDAWNRQRLELAVGEQERQAKLEFIKKRFDAFSKAQNDIDRMEEVQVHFDQASRAVLRAQDELDAARQKIDLKLTFERPREKESKEAPKP
jgi:chromosome segregation ATPase